MTVKQLLRLSERMRLEAKAWCVTELSITRAESYKVHAELWDLCDYLLAQAVQQSCTPLTVAEGLRNV